MKFNARPGLTPAMTFDTAPATTIAVMLICACLLAPIIFFPLSPDLAVFAQGGRALLEGSVLYRDFIDVKPPLVYYLLAFVQFLVGSSEIALRSFDYVWQLLTCLSLYLTVTRSGFNKIAASLSACIYAIVYTTHSPSSTMQCESFAGIALIWALYWFYTFPRNNKVAVLVGVLIGFVICLKYTLTVVLLTMFLYDVAARQLAVRAMFSRWAGIGLGLLAAIAAGLVWPLTPAGVWEQFSIMIDFTMRYSAIKGLGIEAIQTVLIEVPWYLADQLSILVSVGALITLMTILKMRGQIQAGQGNYLVLLLLTSFGLLISVVVERKMFAYHFSRMLVVYIPFCAVGLAALGSTFKGILRSEGSLLRLTVVLTAVFLLIFTPLPRFVKQSIPAIYYLTDQEKFDAVYERPDIDESIIRKQYKQLAYHVKRRWGQADGTLIVATHAAKIYALLDMPTTPRFPSSQFYASPLAPVEWKQDFYRRMQNANHIIIQNNDRFELVTGTDATSAEFIAADTTASRILHNNFKVDTTFSSFTIYTKLDRVRR